MIIRLLWYATMERLSLSRLEFLAIYCGHEPHDLQVLLTRVYFWNTSPEVWKIEDRLTPHTLLDSRYDVHSSREINKS